MAQQNFRNHARYIPLWHIVTGLAILAILGGSLVNLFNAPKENRYDASLLVLVALVLGSFFWYARWFALRAQDRAIRAEENLRHFVLTGKTLPRGLRLGQIIALRFAADEEFPALAQQALSENWAAKEIKARIKDWRPDYHRV